MGKYHGMRDVKKEHYNLGAALDEKKKIEILKEAFHRRVGYELNLENPQTFNEKIMWMKLYYQNPLITRCCDKFAVKGYVAETIGEEYTVPTIAQWSDPDDINFDALPDQFVLKVNWSSGYNIIVPDKSKLSIPAARAQLRKWIQPDRNGYFQYFNWGYKHILPVIYAEKYLEQAAGQVYDYKLFFCNGKFEFMFIATDRHGDDSLTYTYFDSNFRQLPLTWGGRPNANPIPSMPHNIEKMVELAQKLAEPFSFVRVDFYEVNNTEIYVGEMTYYPCGGLLPFEPAHWDWDLGAKIQLPEKYITDKEGPIFKIKSICKKTQLSIIKKAKRFRMKATRLRKRIVRKEQVRANKYIRFLGLRIPYETHIEAAKGCRKKYIRLLGLEFCYKKLQEPKEDAKTDTTHRYEVNPPLQNYMIEDKITPEMMRIHCEQKAYHQLGYFPDLKNPKSFNEKIIWLALNYKNPAIAVAADKGKAKGWIAQKVGGEYVIPLIGVYDSVQDIDFSELPQQFVAKLNDGWGADQIMIVRNKNKLNVDRTKAVLSSWLYPWKNYYYQNMCITDEKMEKPTIVIEQYMEQEGFSALNDFKFYCCNGEPRFALVVTGRGTKQQTRSFVDMDWNVLPVARAGKPSAAAPGKPREFETMLRLCRTLSEGFPLVRVDFYEIDGRVYVGEMTFTPGMFLKFEPRSWDYKLGEYLELPAEKREA